MYMYPVRNSERDTPSPPKKKLVKKLKSAGLQQLSTVFAGALNFGPPAGPYNFGPPCTVPLTLGICVYSVILIYQYTA